MLDQLCNLGGNTAGMRVNRHAYERGIEEKERMHFLLASTRLFEAEAAFRSGNLQSQLSPGSSRLVRPTLSSV